MRTEPTFKIKLVPLKPQDQDRQRQALARVMEIIYDSLPREQENTEMESKSISISIAPAEVR